MSKQDLFEGQFINRFVVVTCRDDNVSGVSRPRVKPIIDKYSEMRVEFPRKLREEFPIGTQFVVTVKVCQKHNKDGSKKGGLYLKAYDVTVLPKSIPDKGLLARVKDGSISGLAYEYVQTVGN